MTPNTRERSGTARNTPERRTAKATAALQARRDGRMEDYAELRRQGVSIRDAARRLGLSTRTLERYRSQLNKEGRDR
ncbi:MAG: helix-turn-helix domain-containing protein [Microbispora sp.]|nr:helix-turn-helix domain-containing protein [Microbispora sp.]